MIRKAFVMQLNRGQLEEYEKRHNPIWPELEDLLRRQGVVSYSIFHHEATQQLFAYAEIEDEESWLEIANFAICQKWWKHMAPLMETNIDDSPKSVSLREVFHQE